MSDEGGERVADVETDDEIGEFVELGRLAVDDDEGRAIALGHRRKTGRRPHDKRRADHEKQIAVARQSLGASHRRFRHGLTERHRRRLDEAP